MAHSSAHHNDHSHHAITSDTEHTSKSHSVVDIGESYDVIQSRVNNFECPARPSATTDDYYTRLDLQENLVYSSHLLYLKTLRCLIYITATTQILFCMMFATYLSTSETPNSQHNNQVMITVLFLTAVFTLYAVLNNNHLLLALIQVVLTVITFFFLVLLVVWCYVRGTKQSSQASELVDGGFLQEGIYFACAMFFALKTVIVRELLQNSIVHGGPYTASETNTRQEVWSDTMSPSIDHRHITSNSLHDSFHAQTATGSKSMTRQSPSKPRMRSKGSNSISSVSRTNSVQTQAASSVKSDESKTKNQVPISSPTLFF
jgi:hypothetical protein